MRETQQQNNSRAGSRCCFDELLGFKSQQTPIMGLCGLLPRQKKKSHERRSRNQDKENANETQQHSNTTLTE